MSLDPLWLTLGVPVEQTTNFVQNTSGYNASGWTMFGAIIVVIATVIFKACAYRQIKDDVHEDNYLVVPYDKISRVDFK